METCMQGGEPKRKARMACSGLVPPPYGRVGFAGRETERTRKMYACEAPTLARGEPHIGIGVRVRCPTSEV